MSCLILTRRTFGSAALTSMMTLAACSSSSSSGSSDGKVTIEVQQQAGDHNVKSVQSTIDLFQKKYPTINVELEIVHSDALGTSNVQVLASDNALDIGILKHSQGQLGGIRPAVH